MFAVRKRNAAFTGRRPLLVAIDIPVMETFDLSVKWLSAASEDLAGFREFQRCAVVQRNPGELLYGVREDECQRCVISWRYDARPKATTVAKPMTSRARRLAIDLLRGEMSFS